MDVPTSTPEVLTPELRAKGSDYFRVWIVNTLLTFLTLGLYSPWARVRNRKYLYQNTFIRDTSFDYHADPWSILFGRIILYLIFLLGYVLVAIVPVFSIPIALCYTALFPFLLVRGLSFEMSNTSFSNIRFRFEKNLARAYEIIIGWGILAAATMGLLLPAALAKWSRFKTTQVGFGQTRFEMSKGEVQAFFKAIGVGFLIVGAFTGVATLVYNVWKDSFILFSSGTPDFTQMGSLEIERHLEEIKNYNPYYLVAFTYGCLAFVALGVLVARPVVEALTKKAVLNRLSLGHGIQFSSDVSGLRLLFLDVTNWILLICTLGLATPWTTIRRQKYILGSMKIRSETQALPFLMATNERDTSKIGAGLDDMFQLDVDLGL